MIGPVVFGQNGESAHGEQQVDVAVSFRARGEKDLVIVNLLNAFEVCKRGADAGGRCRLKGVEGPGNVSCG